MELLLPLATIEAIESGKKEQDRERAENAVDQLLDKIEQMRPRIAEVATIDGARRMTAAVFLYRGVNLLREVRSAEPALATLGLRSVFELAVVARYLLVGRDAVDEFARRYNDSLKTESRMAQGAGASVAPPADFLATLVDARAKPPRDLAAIARQLDEVDQRSESESYSLQSCYRLIYKHIANSSSHASLSSTKRLSRREGDVLMLETEPEPLFSQVPTLIGAALLCELAHATFSAMNLPLDSLPADLVRPREDAVP